MIPVVTVVIVAVVSSPGGDGVGADARVGGHGYQGSCRCKKPKLVLELVLPLVMASVVPAKDPTKTRIPS